MEQNTNFEVGDIVAVSPKQMKAWKDDEIDLIEVKILKITPKRFLVQRENYPPVYVKVVLEII